MVPQLAPIQRCVALAGLAGHEIVLGVSAGAKHERMLARYRRAASPQAAHARLVAQIRDAVESGAPRRAADLLVVLRRLLADGKRAAGVPARRRRARRAPAGLSGTAPVEACRQSRGEAGHVLSTDFRQR